jgi:5-methylcytosine-specific restriction endonuclease McrA
MPTYSRPTKQLMKEFAATLRAGQTFTRQSAIDWFKKHYPRTAARMVYLNVDVMATNNISTRRSHPYTRPDSGHDLFFKIDRSAFRLWDPKRDPAPRYADTRRQGRRAPSGDSERPPTRRTSLRPRKSIADEVRRIANGRLEVGSPGTDRRPLSSPTIEELRRVAALSARKIVPGVSHKVVYRARSRAIRLYALKRAKGLCEGCRAGAPFRRRDGSPYLEVHHVTRLSDGGPDHPAKVIALCPNCHTRAHRSHYGDAFNRHLTTKARRIEQKLRLK